MPTDELGLFKLNGNASRKKWGHLSSACMNALKEYTTELQVSVTAGDLLLIEGSWYVSHSGLLHIAQRRKCAGIDVRPVTELCEPRSSSWTFRAIAYTSKSCKGFVGYGDANPSNVSPRVRGAEMRVAETRAVNRALRKAYGIGVCSVEEIGAFSPGQDMAPQSVPKNGNGHLLRDQLCLVIRKHRLDPALVKFFAAEYCGVDELRKATREQIAAFVTHLSKRAENDRESLLCQLNSYGPVAAPPAATGQITEGAA